MPFCAPKMCNTSPRFIYFLFKFIFGSIESMWLGINSASTCLFMRSAYFHAQIIYRSHISHSLTHKHRTHRAHMWGQIYARLASSSPALYAFNASIHRTRWERSYIVLHKFVAFAINLSNTKIFGLSSVRRLSGPLKAKSFGRRRMCIVCHLFRVIERFFGTKYSRLLRAALMDMHFGVVKRI